MKKYILFFVWLTGVFTFNSLQAQDTTKVVKPTEFTISAELKAD